MSEGDALPEKECETVEDQLIADNPSVECLIEKGLVTHMCARRAGTSPDESAVLGALRAAVAGDIYRVSSMSFVFRIEETDLGGSLAGQSVQKWAALITDHLFTALNLSEETRPLSVQALANCQLPLALKLQSAERIINARPAEKTAVSADVTAKRYEIGHELEKASWEAETKTTSFGDMAADESFAREWQAEVERPDLSAIESALARIEEVVTKGNLESSFAALEQRISGIETALMTVGHQVSEQKNTASAHERIVDDLVRECRQLPERTARHVAARADGLAPAFVALNSVLQRLDARLDEAPEVDLVEQTLVDMQAQLAALATRISEGIRPTDDTIARLTAVEVELSRVPERAAAHMTARAASLVPLHVALSGALHRLECQIETLVNRAEPESGTEDKLRIQIAEFLSRMERRFGEPAATSAPLFPIRHEPDQQNSR